MNPKPPRPPDSARTYRAAGIRAILAGIGTVSILPALPGRGANPARVPVVKTSNGAA